MLQQGGQRRVSVTTKGICLPGPSEQFRRPGIETIPMSEHRRQLLDQILWGIIGRSYV
jgi:hypothetical protein